ncbi:uncharacterized protein LOC132308687 [Cornus florida]|uniref:uncharacterized protein LOC132308687 n=1 Tax=Cornus florida TaxID=4283 RepID=UPI00289CF706|nr:uncharacterized protein LOC132308687 [Cornus florida]
MVQSFIFLFNQDFITNKNSISFPYLSFPFDQTAPLQNLTLYSDIGNPQFHSIYLLQSIYRMEFKFRAIDEQASTYLHYSSTMSYFTEQALRAGYRSNDFGRANDFFRNPSNYGEAMILREIERERIREEIMAAEMGRKRLLVEAEVRREREMMALRRVDGLPLASSSVWFEPRISILNPFEGRRLLEERLALSFEETSSYSNRRRKIGGLETSETMPFERFVFSLSEPTKCEN